MTNWTITIVLISVFLYHVSASTDQLPNIWEVVNKDERLKILAAALKAADLEEASQQPGPFTVFAPLDKAFESLPQDVIEHYSDPKNKDKLARLLSYHAVGPKAVKSTDLLEMNLPTRLETLTGDFIEVSQQDNSIKINNATVIVADIMASNGVIHIIDDVLIPKVSRK